MKEDLQPLDNESQNATALLTDLQDIISRGKSQAVAAVNSTLTLTYWHVGKRINDGVLKGERAEYGKQVVPSLAKQLVELYGKSFEARNLRRMMQFAEVFPDIEIVSPLVSQLSWTHFTILMALPNEEARLYYARHSSEHLWSKRELTRQIERKAFERAEIADGKMELTESSDLKADLAKFDDKVLPILSERAQDFVPGETETVPAGSVFAKLKDKYQKADSR